MIAGATAIRFASDPADQRTRCAVPCGH